MAQAQEYGYISRRKCHIDEIAHDLYNNENQHGFLERFININSCATNDGEVDVGQALYLPHHLLNHDDSTYQNIVLNLKSQHDKLSIKKRKAIAHHHQLLSFAAAVVPGVGFASAEMLGDMYRYRISQVAEVLQKIETEFFKTMQRNGKITSTFERYRAMKLKELDFALGNFVRTVVLSHPARKAKMWKQIGINWRSEVLDWQQRGPAKANIENFPKYYAKLGKVSKVLDGVGPLVAIGDSVSDFKESYAVCQRSGFGHQCLASTSGSVLGGVGNAAGMEIGFQYGGQIGMLIGTIVGGPVVGSTTGGMLGAMNGAYLGSEALKYVGSRLGRGLINIPYFIYVKVRTLT